MSDKGKYKLKRYNFSVAVDFSCESCGRPILARLADIDGPFTCRGCGKHIAMPPIRCRDDNCAGIYRKCGGPIAKLYGEELEKERAAAWEGESPGGRPTDSDHDDYRDIVRHDATMRYDALS